MRTYKFSYKSNDDEDFPEKIKYSNTFNSYLDKGETNLDEFASEARKFLMACGYLPSTTCGLVYLKWNKTKFDHVPEYDDEYLVKLKGNSYATADKWVDGKWEKHSNDEVEAWAEMPELA